MTSLNRRLGEDPVEREATSPGERGRSSTKVVPTSRTALGRWTAAGRSLTAGRAKTTSRCPSREQQNRTTSVTTFAARTGSPSPVKVLIRTALPSSSSPARARYRTRAGRQGRSWAAKTQRRLAMKLAAPETTRAPTTATTSWPVAA